MPTKLKVFLEITCFRFSFNANGLQSIVPSVSTVQLAESMGIVEAKLINSSLPSTLGVSISKHISNAKVD